MESPQKPAKWVGSRRSDCHRRSKSRRPLPHRRRRKRSNRRPASEKEGDLFPRHAARKESTNESLGFIMQDNQNLNRRRTFLLPATLLGVLALLLAGVLLVRQMACAGERGSCRRPAAETRSGNHAEHRIPGRPDACRRPDEPRGRRGTKARVRMRSRSRSRPSLQICAAIEQQSCSASQRCEHNISAPQLTTSPRRLTIIQIRAIAQVSYSLELNSRIGKQRRPHSKNSHRGIRELMFLNSDLCGTLRPRSKKRPHWPGGFPIKPSVITRCASGAGYCWQFGSSDC